VIRPAALVLATLLAACASASSSPDEASSTGALQAGVADPGHPAVGMLWQNSGAAQGVFCTGTLVAPDVVLAAAHCVADITDATFYTGAGAAQSEFSETPPPGMVAHAVAASIADPDYVADPDGCPNRTPDVGLFQLAAPITDIAPVPYARQPTATSGMICDGVGFGIHAEPTDETAGQKRTGTEPVRAIAPASIEVGAGTGIADSGDSGGPLLCGGVIAGVTSCHLDGEWPQHKVEHYARIDAAAAWIDRQISSWHASSPPVR
jgi:hypothetical protein